MYLPPHFREDDLAELHGLMRRLRLATLVTVGEQGPFATHLPLLLSAEPAPFGTLHGHVARANEHALCDGMQALAIFLGPDAYVSPSWYATKRESGKVVPTWNYVAVHASGTLRTFNDPARLLDLVRRLTERHEQPRERPWAVDDAPSDFIHAQLRGIIGLELRIDRLEGKWKLSQNRGAADRAGVIGGLRQEGDADQVAIADLMMQRPEGAR